MTKTDMELEIGRNVSNAARLYALEEGLLAVLRQMPLLPLTTGETRLLNV
jgi:hypothetical protein